MTLKPPPQRLRPMFEGDDPDWIQSPPPPPLPISPPEQEQETT